MNRPVDLIIKAKWVLPIVPAKQLYENYAVIISNRNIIDILPISELGSRYVAEETITLSTQLLMPGLINLHTHAAMNLMRGLADDLPLMDWLNHHIWPAEREFVSEKFVFDGTLLASAEMLKGGITCFNDMYFYPQASVDAAIQAGIRANIGLTVLDFPTNYANDADDYLQKGLDARDCWRNLASISSNFAPHAPYTVSNQTFEKIVTYSEQLNIGIHTHLHETTDEIEQSLQQYGMRPLQRLKELGVLSPSLVAAHGVHLLEDEMATLAQYGCHIAHCPSSNLKLASGFASVANLLQHGVNVGIGTDGAASNNRLDMFVEMRSAALLAKAVSNNASSVDAFQALQMATLNAAKALGLEAKIGSIEIGKQADLIAVKIDDIDNSPIYDPISHLVYVAGREHVTHTWVAGDLRYQKLDDGLTVYANIEPNELKSIVAYWQPKLSEFKQNNH